MSFLESLAAFPWMPAINAVRFLLVIADFILLILAIYWIRETLMLRPPLHRAAPADRRTTLKGSPDIAMRWKAVLAKAAASPESATLAVIEADTLVDDVLRRLGLTGETMADRLDQLDPQEIKTLDRLWRVHRIRNALVHRPGFSISSADATEMLGAYESFLKEVEILE